MEIIRNMFRRKLRTFLTVFGIVIGVLALVVMGAMAEKINLLIKGGENYLVNSIAISPKGSSNSFGGMVAFPDTYGNEAKKIKGVKVVTNSVSLLFDEEMQAVNMGIPKMIMGVSADEQKEAEKYLDPSLQVGFAQGGYWKEGERNKAVLGVDIAKDLKAKVGGTVENRGVKFEVVGILNRTMTAPDNVMMVPLEDSRVLSVTDINMVLITDKPPTNKAIKALPITTILKTSVPLVKFLMFSLGETTFQSG